MAKWDHLLDHIPADFPKDEPVFMLNLLQFYDRAQYPEGSKHTPCSGREAWVVRYTAEFGKLATEAGGFELIYLGRPASKIVGEDGEQWDAVVLVKYTSMDTFRTAIGSDEYATTAAQHRDATLKDWKLIASVQATVPV